MKTLSWFLLISIGLFARLHGGVALKEQELIDLGWQSENPLEPHDHLRHEHTKNEPSHHEPMKTLSQKGGVTPQTVNSFAAKSMQRMLRPKVPQKKAKKTKKTGNKSKDAKEVKKAQIAEVNFLESVINTDGQPCPSQQHCSNVACAHEKYEWNHVSPYICCPEGKYLSVPASLVPQGDTAWNVCGLQQINNTCFANELCQSGMCSAGKCIGEKIADWEECPSGFPQHCQSNVCGLESEVYICCPGDSWDYGNDGLVHCSRDSKDCGEDMLVEWSIKADQKYDSYSWWITNFNGMSAAHVVSFEDDKGTILDKAGNVVQDYPNRILLPEHTTIGSKCIPRTGCHYAYLQDFGNDGFDFSNVPDAGFQIKADGAVVASYSEDTPQWPDGAFVFTGADNGFGNSCLGNPPCRRYAGGSCVRSSNGCAAPKTSLLDIDLCPGMPYSESYCCMDPIECSVRTNAGICQGERDCPLYFAPHDECPQEGMGCCYSAPDSECIRIEWIVQTDQNAYTDKDSWYLLYTGDDGSQHHELDVVTSTNNVQSTGIRCIPRSRCYSPLFEDGGEARSTGGFDFEAQPNARIIVKADGVVVLSYQVGDVWPVGASSYIGTHFGDSCRIRMASM